MNAALQRLRAEIRFDREVFGQRLSELEAIDLGPGTSTVAQRAHAAVALHHAYGAVESLLVRVARQIEGSLPEGPDWHQALVHAMGLEVPAVRPAVLSPPVVQGLRRLLGFRHFFRHAYAVELDPAQLDALRREAVTLAPALAADLDRLDAFLAQAAEAAQDRAEH